jgi:glutamate-1-semialdehyde 2,1-aminomutase
MVTRFNDSDALEQLFGRWGERIACFIVEPVVGAGGSIPAEPAYMHLARQLTEKHGALLILDEVISGFRFRAGDAGRLYGVQPDLFTFGKVIGGGMPVAAVAGRAEVMRLAGREGGRRVRFDGGTYSAHPSSLMAGKLMLTYLIEHEDEVYPRLAGLGHQARTCLERIFADQGIVVRCTGHPNEAVKGSSLGGLHFLTDPDTLLDSPDVVNDPARSQITVREQILKLAFLLEDVYIMHGLGALSTAHTEQDLNRLCTACERVASRLRGLDMY